MNIAFVFKDYLFYLYAREIIFTLAMVLSVTATALILARREFKKKRESEDGADVPSAAHTGDNGSMPCSDNSD